MKKRFKQTITHDVPHDSRTPENLPASEEVTFELAIDLDRVKAQLASAAAANKGGESRALNGLITCKRIK